MRKLRPQEVCSASAPPRRSRAARTARPPLLDLRREQHLAAPEYQPVPGRGDDDLVHAHVRRRFRDEAHHASHVFHLQHARLIFRRWRLGPRLLQRRDRLAGVDRAAADPVHAFLDVDLMDQRAQRLLARVVGCPAEIALIAGEIRHDVDHEAVAPLAHRGQHRERAVERAVQVDADDAVPIGRREILEEALRDVGDRAVDEDVDAAVPRENRCPSALDRLLVAGIDCRGLAFAAGLLDQRRGFGERIGAPPRYDHRRAASCELDRGRLPDAAAAARHPGDFSAQWLDHATASVVSRIGGRGESSVAQIARSSSASASVSLSSAIAVATQALMKRGFFSGARRFSSLRALSTAAIFSSEGERSTPPAAPRAAIPLSNAAIPPLPECASSESTTAASAATAATMRYFTAGGRLGSVWIWVLHSVSSTNSPSVILRSASITPFIFSSSPSRSGPGSRFRVGITNSSTGSRARAPSGFSASANRALCAATSAPEPAPIRASYALRSSPSPKRSAKSAACAPSSRPTAARISAGMASRIPRA